MAYPTDLDAWPAGPTPPGSLENVSASGLSLPDIFAKLSAELDSLKAKLGIDTSPAAGSIDYRLSILDRGPITADVDGATVTFSLDTSNKHTVTLGGNRTLALSGGRDGQVFMVILKQDGTGSRTVTWWSGIRWPGGVAPTLTATADKEDTFSFIRRASGDYQGMTVALNQ